jgi:hypothetical protein
MGIKRPLETTRSSASLVTRLSIVCVVLVVVVWFNFSTGGGLLLPLLSKANEGGLGDGTPTTKVKITKLTPQPEKHGVKTGASVKQLPTKTENRLSAAVTVQRRPNAAAAFNGSDEEAEDEPRYEVDVGKFEKIYTPMFTPLSAVKAEYRALARAVPMCRIGKRRQTRYTLFDSTLDDASDVDPPLSVAVAHRRMKGDKLSHVMGNWPSQKLKLQPVTDGSGGPDGFQRAYENLPSTATMTCIRRNAVVGVAASYDDAKLVVLVSSFQRYASPCDVLVVMRDHCSPHWHVAPPPAPRVECAPLGSVSMHTAERERIGRIEAWVSRNWRRYDYIIHVDSRDTQFFADPFAPLYAANVSGLFAVGEAFRYSDFPTGQSRMWVGSYSSGGADQDPSIIDWIAQLRLGGRSFPTICSGMYGGSAAALNDFMYAYKEAINTASSHAQHLHGVDQGILIHLFIVGLVLRKFPHPIYLFDEALGPYTHFLHRELPMMFSPDGRLLNCDLAPYAIAHQLDRHDEVDWRQKARFRPHKASSHTGDPNCRDTTDAVANALRCSTGDNADVQLAFDGIRRLAAKQRPQQHQKASRPAPPPDPRMQCGQRHVMIALVAQLDMTHLHVFVASFLRHHSACVDLHLLMLLPRGSHHSGQRSYRHLLRFGNTSNVHLHEFVRESSAAAPPTGEERLQTILVFMRSHNFARVAWVAVFTTIGGGTKEVLEASKSWDGLDAVAMEQALLAEHHVLLSGDLFGYMDAAHGEEGFRRPEVFVPLEAYSEGNLPETAQRPAAMAHHLVAHQQLVRCLSALVGHAEATRFASDFQSTEPPRGCAGSSGDASSSSKYRSRRSVVANPSLVVGGGAALLQYLATAAAIVSPANGAQCSMAATLGYLLPVALSTVPNDVGKESAALRVRLWEPYAVSPLRLARGGLQAVDFTEHGQIVDRCMMATSVKHKLPEGFPVVVGLEASTTWKMASQGYVLGASPDRVGDEDPDALAKAFATLTGVKSMPRDSKTHRDRAFTMVPFARRHGLQNGDMLPFATIYPNGTSFLMPSRRWN